MHYHSYVFAEYNSLNNDDREKSQTTNDEKQKEIGETEVNELRKSFVTLFELSEEIKKQLANLEKTILELSDSMANNTHEVCDTKILKLESILKEKNKEIEGLNASMANDTHKVFNKKILELESILEEKTKKIDELNASIAKDTHEETEFRLPYMLEKHLVFDDYMPIDINIHTTKSKKALFTDMNKCTCGAKDECSDSCLNRVLQQECIESECQPKSKCQNRTIQKGLKAPIKAFETDKKGYGLLATNDIQQGTFIVEFVGEVIRKEQYRTRSQQVYQNSEHVYAMTLERNYVIDAHRMGNLSRFINHSCDPNSEIQKWTVDSLPRLCVVAIKDILAGEEVTFDYKFHSFDQSRADECKCGSELCRGVISRKSNQPAHRASKRPAPKTSTHTFLRDYKIPKLVISINLFMHSSISQICITF